MRNFNHLSVWEYQTKPGTLINTKCRQGERKADTKEKRGKGITESPLRPITTLIPGKQTHTDTGRKIKIRFQVLLYWMRLYGVVYGMVSYGEWDGWEWEWKWAEGSDRIGGGTWETWSCAGSFSCSPTTSLPTLLASKLQFNFKNQKVSNDRLLHSLCGYFPLNKNLLFFMLSCYVSSCYLCSVVVATCVVERCLSSLDLSSHQRNAAKTSSSSKQQHLE